ncbi:MAG TPA: Cof-type HAD-IIB family hydrolase [Jiangellaceae bacterium]
MNWRPDLIALDVDGTVLGFDGSLSPSVTHAVRRARDAGITVAIATGRSMHSTLPVCWSLGLDNGYAVSSNGAVVVDVGTRTAVDVSTFDPTESVRFFADHVPDALLAVEQLGVGYLVTGEFPPGELDGEIVVVSHDELLTGPVTRLVARMPNGNREEFFELAHAAGLRGVDYAIGYSAWIDFMPEGVSKASGLAAMCDRLGVAAADVLAVGDGHNDMEMLAWAGRGVAMGQAPDDVKAVADDVCPPVEADGVAVLLGEYIGQRA